jgi:hypothetical protein
MAKPGDEREVLPDNARLVRWTGPAFALFTLVLIPWIVYLSSSLPERQVSHHYNTAWVGFDIMEAVALAGTAYCAFRRSRYLALTASAAATLLVVDAWFDVMTSPRHEQWQAIVLAVLVELPLAAVCAWLSYHTEHLEARRIDLLLAHRWNPVGEKARR